MSEQRYGNDDNQADQRPDRSEGMGRGRDHWGIQLCMHAGLHAVANGVGKKTSPQKRTFRSRVALAAQRIRNVRCASARVRLVNKAERGHWQGTGGESNERLKPTFYPKTELDSNGLRVFVALARCCMRRIGSESKASPALRPWNVGIIVMSRWRGLYDAHCNSVG